MEPFKWPEPYDHTDQATWDATHGILKYIYNRDVVENHFLLPSDFFMKLFSHAVSGTAKSIITGQFQSMMARGQTWDGLGLLKEMDDAYRDKNAEQTAAALLHACRQFRDEALSSFLPRYQHLLARSSASAGDEKQKLYQLANSLNQVTQNYLIGRNLPEEYIEFIKYLSVIGSQIERVGTLKTRIYLTGQTGYFDDGTRGIAGGKLLGGGSMMNQYRPTTGVSNNKDADGDTRMTGVNRIHARWVSRIELDKRKSEGACLRCGKLGHLIGKCNYLPPKRPETGMNTSKFNEQDECISEMDYKNDQLKE